MAWNDNQLDGNCIKIYTIRVIAMAINKNNS